MTAWQCVGTISKYSTEKGIDIKMQTQYQNDHTMHEKSTQYG